MKASSLASPSTLAGLAVASIWFAVFLASVFSPDMVTGSQQEHLPIAAIIDWVQGAIATGFVMLAAAFRRAGTPGSWAGAAIAIAAIWMAAALASVFGPVFVTGSDPTRLPLAAIVGPVMAAVATGFVAIYAAGQREG